MSTPRVVITGGAGFLGSHLCSYYVDAGWDVVAVDNLSSGLTRNVASMQGSESFSLVQADVTKPLELEGSFDLVLHFASLASPPYYKQFPIETLEVGAIGTQRMLELAVKNDARFVFASTSEVYGDPEVHPQVESYYGHVNPIGPRSMYDESKRYAEALIMAYQSAKNANAGMVRIFNTYGPRMRSDDGRVVTNFLTQILAGQPLTIHGDGTQTRSFCFVDDLVAGIADYAASDLKRPVNLGDPDTEMSIRDLAQRLSTLFDRPFTAAPPMPRQDENDPMRRNPDITLARKTLGWQPKVTFEDGMRETAAWLKAVDG
ncbi:MAG: dTDP-glucose 4,6-dehydratase [Myxococcota bacterium]|jgi:dTDP-glucose 4,6-dehydratase